MIQRIAAAAALAVALLAIPFPASATTLIDNVKGISINRQGQVKRFTAMVIDDRGRVAQLLAFGDKPTEHIDYRDDLHGKVVVPGFVDSHVHLMAMGLATLTLDLTGTQSLAATLAKVARFGKDSPNRPWIIGRGWNQRLWTVHKLPTATELDSATDRPAILTRVDGQAVWANSAALAAAGITAATPDPQGGRIERLSGSRKPSGILLGSAMALVEKAAPPPLATDRVLALYNAEQELLSQGVTAVADMGTTIEDWMTYRRAGDAGRLNLRIMAYADSIPDMLLIGGTGPTVWLYHDRLRLEGVNLVLDGSLGARSAWLKKPYADDPHSRGLQQMGGTPLRNLMSRASMSHFQVAIDATGDAATAEALGAIDQLAQDYHGDRRWRIEGAQVVDPSHMAKFGAHGTIASVQPVAETTEHAMAAARLGPDRLAGAYAWHSIAASGAPLAFGSNAPARTPDVLAGIAAAVSREDAAGAPAGGWHPGETISREAALAAYTAGGAYAGFANGRFGSLAVGERADFVVLSGDPLNLPAAQIDQIKVLQTWIGGKRVWSIGNKVAPKSDSTKGTGVPAVQ